MRWSRQYRKIGMGIFVFCGGVFLITVASAQDPKRKINGMESHENAIMDSSYVSDKSVMNDLVYRSYGDAYTLGKGSTWRIQKKVAGIDLADYENAKIYVVNLQSGAVTSVLRDKIKEDIEYEIPEDGVYKIYLCLDEDNNGEVIDLKPYLKVTYCDSCERNESGGVLLLNH